MLEETIGSRIVPVQGALPQLRPTSVIICLLKGHAAAWRCDRLAQGRVWTFSIMFLLIIY